MIQFQIGGRKTGKTTQLLNWMKQAPEGERRIMVCATDQMAKYCFSLAEGMGMNVTPNNFITYEECQYLRGHSNLKLGVDNLDMMLQSIFCNPVGFVTATGEDTLRMIT